MRTRIYITYLNYLGGFEYFDFSGYQDRALEVYESGQTKKNVFATWPKSYGANADTITKSTFRKTRKQLIIRSQGLTESQAHIMGEAIRSSVVVELVTSRRDKRRLIIDDSSVTITRGIDKMHGLSFTGTYTDDYPSQTC